MGEGWIEATGPEFIGLEKRASSPRLVLQCSRGEKETLRPSKDPRLGFWQEVVLNKETGVGKQSNVTQTKRSDEQPRLSLFSTARKLEGDGILRQVRRYMSAAAHGFRRSVLFSRMRCHYYRHGYLTRYM